MMMSFLPHTSRNRRAHRMHEQRGDAQREEAVDKNLTTHVSIVGALGGLNAVSPMLLRPANEVVHERHDRMQFSLVHDGLVFRHGLMAARHHVAAGAPRGMKPSKFFCAS